jgi:putative transcriptional regulator
MSESLRGKLLVASPQLTDGVFDRTVVFVIEHGDLGAVGVVLNRPGDTEVSHPLPTWWDRAGPPPVVFVGGPMRPRAVICLGLASVPAEEIVEDAGFQPVFDELGVVDLSRDPETVPVARLRVFAGHAGWVPGQLEAEVEAGGWFVCEATVMDAVSPEPEDLWSEVLRRQPDPALVRLANYPPDPSLN